jgi:hypothetical protein
MKLQGTRSVESRFVVSWKVTENTRSADSGSYTRSTKDIASFELWLLPTGEPFMRHWQLN